MSNIKRKIKGLFLSATLLSLALLTVNVSDIHAKKKVSLCVGDTYKIKVEKNTKYTFVSKNKKIAKVSKKGVITGLKKGKCKVVVNTKGKKIIYTITVKKNKNSPVNPTYTPEPVYTPNPTQPPSNGPKVGGERVIAQGIISEIQPLETGKCRYKIECNKFSFVSVSDKVKYAYVTVNGDRDYYKVGNEVMLFSFSDVDYTVVDESSISFNVDFMNVVN